MNEINIGAVILDLRKKLGMTQEQLAEIVGVSPPAVSKWETGASCPDVALLAPIARALNTDMNTLLSFHAELPTEGLLDAVKEVQTLAEQDGPAAMERILTLTRRYPTDTHLRFQLSCLAMGLPQLYCWPEEAKEAAWDFAEQSFAYVRQHGEKNLWPTVTYMLAGLLLNRDKLDQAEELLDSLPVMPMSPQMLYAVLHQRRDQPEKAWDQARMQVVSGGQTVLQALALLAASDAPDASKALAAYGTVAQALGYPPCLLNIQLAAHAIESGNEEEALQKLGMVIQELKEETEQAHPFWYSPSQSHPDPSYFRTLGRMLQNSLRADSKFQSLRKNPQFEKILRQLAPEA